MTAENATSGERGTAQRGFSLGIKGTLALASVAIALGGGIGSAFAGGAAKSSLDLLSYKIGELTKKVDNLSQSQEDRFTSKNFADWRERHDRLHEKTDARIRTLEAK